MLIFFTILCAILLAVSVLTFLIARLSRKWNDEEAGLNRKAYIYLIKEDKHILRKKLYELDELIVEMATDEVETSVPFEVIERARELLIEAINVKESPC